MTKAVVKVGGKQYLVTEKETLLVDLLPEGTKELTLDALLVVDGDKTTVGTPVVKGVTVKATVVDDLVKKRDGLNHAVRRRVLVKRLIVLAQRRNEDHGRHVLKAVDPLFPLVSCSVWRSPRLSAQLLSLLPMPMT